MTQLMRSTAATPSIPKVVGAFAVVALGTAAVMMVDLISPSLTHSGLQQNAVRLGVIGVLLYGAWLALTRARFSDRGRLTMWSVIAVALLVWQSIVWSLALGDMFEGQIGQVPRLPLAIALPLLIGLPILLRSKSVGRMLDATPPSWLVGVQVYRVFGSVFLTGWLAGNLSAMPAVPAGAGDALVGILALPVALVLASQARGGWSLAVAWNVLGILDLVNAIMLNALANPGGPPSGPDPVAAFPLVLIPAFGVPLSLLLHSASLRQLRRTRSSRL